MAKGSEVDDEEEEGGGGRLETNSRRSEELVWKGQEAAARAMLNLASSREAAVMLADAPGAISALCELMVKGRRLVHLSVCFLCCATLFLHLCVC